MALLEIQNLSVEFETELGIAHAVDGVSLTLEAGQVVALVGESGCGKSVTAMSILRLIPEPPGRIRTGHVWFQPPSDDKRVDILRLSPQQLRRIRGRHIAMVFQEPTASLNPVLTIGDQITEGMIQHLRMTKAAAKKRALELLDRVGLRDPGRIYRDYAHRLSGGMCQRAMIAMALACRPEVLIADEPTTALDVTIQAQILDLLQELQAEYHLGVLFISHDLALVSQIAHRVCVMYAGRIIESGPAQPILQSPLHPYTQSLIECQLSRFNPAGIFKTIPGQVPSATDYPDGCRFHPRCFLTQRRATENGRAIKNVVRNEETVPVLARCIHSTANETGGNPELRELRPGRWVACWEAH